MPDPTPRTPWQLEAERQRSEAALPPSGDLIDREKLRERFIRAAADLWWNPQVLTAITSLIDAAPVVASLRVERLPEALDSIDEYPDQSADSVMPWPTAKMHAAAILAALTETEPKP